MNRRTALRTLVLGAAATVTDPVPAPFRPSPASGDRLAGLVQSMSRDRAHVIVVDPDSGPDAIWDPVLDLLRERGDALCWSDLVRPSRRRGEVLLLDDPDLPVRRFRLELEELDRQARNGAGMVLARWYRTRANGTGWIPWFGEAVECVIHVRGLDFDGPPNIVPTHYRVPVDVYRQGRRVDGFSVVREIATRSRRLIAAR